MRNYDKRPAQVQVNGEQKHSIKKRKEDVKGCAVGTYDALRRGVKMDQNKWELREPWWPPVPVCSQVAEQMSSLCVVTFKLVFSVEEDLGKQA